MSLMGRRSFETLAMLMIGDGLLSLTQPKRHVALWRRGPPAWQAIVAPFAGRPVLTATLGAAGLAAGLWLARRQSASGAPGGDA